MTKLTQKQERFCAELALGKTKSQAYRKAYDTSGMSERTVWSEAHRLSNHPKVAPKLSIIHAQCEAAFLDSAIADREELLVSVTDILRSQSSSDSAKLKSAEILGKYYALFDGTGYGKDPKKSPDELLSELNDLLGTTNQSRKRTGIMSTTTTGEQRS